LGGSGIAYLADAYRKPYLYLNSWHLATPVPSSLAVVVPALLQNREGKELSFREQISIFLNTLPDGTVPEFENYQCRNAGAEEIFDAMGELEDLLQNPRPRSSLQESVRMLGIDLPLFYAGSRFSQSFLVRHQELLK
jgi:hypothetical protein